MSDGYYKYRQQYGSDSGSLAVTAFTGQTTLATAKFKGQNTVYVQRLHIHVSSASAGVTWSIQDSAGVLVTGLIPASVAPTPDPAGAEYDFGPVGFNLTKGASLVFVPSGLGAVGDITWDAYQRLDPTVVQNFIP